MEVIRIKNWRTFQHYKDRRPPWIKLHREIMDNFEFSSMSDASRAIAPCLWLLASEYDSGEIPHDVPMLAFRLRMPTSKITRCLHELERNGFIIRDSDVLASRKQGARLETEVETYKEEAEIESDTRVRETTSNGGSLHFSGTRLKITSEEHKALSLAFEGADFVTEYLKMDSWLVTNHRNYRAFGRFANGWLSRQKLPNIGGQNGTSKHSDQQLRTIAAAKRALERRGIGGTDEVLTTLPPRTN